MFVHMTSKRSMILIEICLTLLVWHGFYLKFSMSTCSGRKPKSQCHCERKGRCDFAWHVFGYSSAEESKAKVVVNTQFSCSRNQVEHPPNSENYEYSDFEAWLQTLHQDYLQTFPIDLEYKNYVRPVKNVLFSTVSPTPFRTYTRLVAVADDVLSDCLNLKPTVTQSPLFLDFVSGNNRSGLFLPSLAHRYGGHQFGYWAGQLGDGRAVLMGVFTNSNRESWELQLKGSGKTPYSRSGDGRAVLRSSVREFLASEAMHYLGVPTSRALSLIVSDDVVIRDQFYDGHPIAEQGAVVLRLAPSWFRFGSLEILARAGEVSLLRSLLDHVIENHFKDIDVQEKNRYLLLFQEIVINTAKMIAKWQSVGFTHGVCNTDNFSLLSITIDYGPFGIMEDFSPTFVPNTSDDEGRYSYQNQPDVGFYNLEKLMLALESVLDKPQTDAARMILQNYGYHYQQGFMELFTNKFGLSSVRNEDENLIAMFLKIMQDTKADFTMSFRQLGEIPLKELLTGNIDKHFWALLQLQRHDRFKEFLESYKSRLKVDGVSDKMRRTKMARHNPVYVLRNWMAQNAIMGAENDDFTEIQMLHRILRQPFVRQDEGEKAGFSSKPPRWAAHLKWMNKVLGEHHIHAVVTVELFFGDL